MRRSRASSEESSLEEPLINLTPLIDVVFVVLITFMLIAPVLHLDHVELASSSQTKESVSPNQSPITIHVKADNTIWFQGRSLSAKELGEKLKLEKSSYPNQVPQVIQDHRASFGSYQTVKNTLENCGFDQMDVVLSPAQ
jgi:Biopolymer transport protein